eukprot:Skav207600  [mRNA]  locus=scaffold2450:161164:174184:+ [translate_table: standard]
MRSFPPAWPKKPEVFTVVKQADELSAKEDLWLSDAREFLQNCPEWPTAEATSVQEPSAELPRRVQSVNFLAWQKGRASTEKPPEKAAFGCLVERELTLEGLEELREGLEAPLKEAPCLGPSAFVSTVWQPASASRFRQREVSTPRNGRVPRGWNSGRSGWEVAAVLLVASGSQSSRRRSVALRAKAELTETTKREPAVRNEIDMEMEFASRANETLMKTGREHEKAVDSEAKIRK